MDKKIRKTLGKQIKQERTRQGHSQYWLAKECGLTQTTLNKIEAGEIAGVEYYHACIVGLGGDGITAKW